MSAVHLGQISPAVPDAPVEEDTNPLYAVFLCIAKQELVDKQAHLLAGDPYVVAEELAIQNCLAMQKDLLGMQQLLDSLKTLPLPPEVKDWVSSMADLSHNFKPPEAMTDAIDNLQNQYNFIVKYLDHWWNPVSWFHDYKADEQKCLDGIDEIKGQIQDYGKTLVGYTGQVMGQQAQEASTKIENSLMVMNISFDEMQNIAKQKFD